MVSHIPAKFVGHRYLSGGYIMFLVCPVISQDSVTKG